MAKITHTRKSSTEHKLCLSLILLMASGALPFSVISNSLTMPRSGWKHQTRCRSNTKRYLQFGFDAVKSRESHTALGMSSFITDTDSDYNTDLVGDDSASFSLESQKILDWIKFSVATGTVLAVVSYAWFLPTGPHLGDALLDNVQSTIGTTDPALTIFALLMIFAVSHSGLASLRPAAEEIVGPRAWRVVFAVVSLPLALSCISYFVNHAHEGTRLWDLTHVPGVHEAFFLANFVSFLFLYPSTFNLLEVAAIEKPQLHLWETGIIRITRHPQAMGQIMWCAAHTAWLGTTTSIAASSVLVAHHIFSVWNGDRRLKDQHGKAFEIVKSKTSVIPFAAILDGRQELPEDYYKEFLRGPYLLVVGGTLAAYMAHPWMMAGAALLQW